MAFARPFAEVMGCNYGFVAGRILSDTATISLQSLTAGTLMSGEVSVSRIGAGRYQVNINKFRGPNAIVIPYVCAGSSNTAALGVTTAPGLGTSISLNSFSSVTPDLYTFTVGITSGNTFTDADVYFSAWSF